MTALGLAIMGAGVILCWSAIKGEDPRAVISSVLSGSRKLPKGAQPLPNASDPAGGGGGFSGGGGSGGGGGGFGPTAVHPRTGEPTPV